MKTNASKWVRATCIWLAILLAMGLVLIFGFIVLGRMFFYIPSKCEASADARKVIIKKLTSDESLTLRAVPTLSDDDASCSLTFHYTKEGNVIEASAIVDPIHGLKFSEENISNK